MALPLSKPLDVQLGRRGSGEQQTMNLKSKYNVYLISTLVKQPSSYYYTLISHPIENPREGKTETVSHTPPRLKLRLCLRTPSFRQAVL